jgi:prepilin-type N-terminal cleavage/methylation domain-containing protein
MKTDRAFTLIELLVVVAIIALLVSILLPTLQKAKSRTKRVICQSNEHQLGVALSSYAADNRKYPHRINWGYWPFGPHVWYENGNDSNPPFPASFSLLFECRYLELDEKQTRFLYCPANKHFSYEEQFVGYQADPTLNPDWPNKLNYEIFYTTYCYWGGFSEITLGNIDDQLDKVLVSRPDDDGNKVLVSDQTLSFYWDSDIMDSGWSSHGEGYGGKIEGGASLYNDGSVKWIKFEDMYNNYKRHRWNQWPDWNHWF